MWGTAAANDGQWERYHNRQQITGFYLGCSTEAEACFIIRSLEKTCPTANRTMTVLLMIQGYKVVDNKILLYIWLFIAIVPLELCADSPLSLPKNF